MRKAIFSLLGFATLSAAASSPDYTKGVFIVNEDWYGHNNSTLNHLDPDNPDGDYWTYRVIQHENEGMELGATNQFGAISEPVLPYRQTGQGSGGRHNRRTHHYCRCRHNENNQAD